MKLYYHKLLVVLLFVCSYSFAQEIEVSGLVTDDQGLPLPGVNVVVKNTNNGTQTDFDGKYKLTAKIADILSFSFIGFSTQTISIEDEVINIQMAPDSAVLEEVVVVGFGTNTERKLIQNIGTIRAKAIEDLPSVTAQEMLQGQTSGVQFTQSSGILGAANVIRVRGVASLNGGSQPLIVLDGVPLSDDVNTFNNGGNTGLNPIADINPQDIESFSVLKDAAATAIWGSRGANGVILIKTKTGKTNSDTRINADVWTSFTDVTDLLNILSPEEYAEYRLERGLAGASGGISAISDLPEGGSDWVDLATRTGFSQNYSISAQGGGEKTSFFLGTGYSDLEGGIVGNDLRRINGRININHNANSWLDLGLNLSVTNTLNDRINTENTTFAPLTSSYLIRPFVESRDEEGNFINNDFIQNVEAIEALQENQVESTRIVGNMNATIHLTNSLNYKAAFGIDRSQNDNFVRIPELIDPSADGGTTPGGTAQNFIANDNRIISDHTLSYNKVFNDLHTLSGVGGISYQETTFNTINVASDDFLSDDLRNVSNGAVPTLTAQSREKRSLYGVFGRVGYDYAGKYLFEGSFRRDGFSRFGANRRFGNFWSAALGWVISEEPFLQRVEEISLLKIRASYGTSGNDRIGNSFPSLGLFGSAVPLLTATYNYNGSGGIAPIQPVNLDLTYEESATLDLGFDLGLFNSRINLNVNYFEKRTTDLLLAVPITEITGFGTINKNAGELKNSGFELTLNTKNIFKTDFTWSTDFNISFVDTEVVSLPGANDSEEGKFIEAAGARQRAIEGMSTNNFYLVRYVGVNPETGDAEYLDREGNVTTTPNFDTDRVVVGDALPDFYGGITNTFTYKNFDLSFLMSFTYGNDIFLDGLRFSGAPDRVGTFNQSTDVLDYWREPGDIAKYPRLGSSTESLYRQPSTFQLRDGSFLRMRNITFGYSLPDSMLKNSKLFKKVRVYATGNNLFVIKAASDLDGFDPEVTDNIDPLIQGETFFTAPQARQILLGTRITF